jgi:hypothetical protein
MNRSAPNGIPELVFLTEVQILNELMPRYGRIKPALSEYLVRLASGGYLDGLMTLPRKHCYLEGLSAERHCPGSANWYQNCG